MSKFTSLIKARFESVAQGQKEKQKGASALEYIVLAAVIVLAVAAGAWLLVGENNTIGEKFNEIKCSLTSSDPTSCKTTEG